MKDSLYHSLLRMASLTVALVLLFESGLLHPVTKEMALDTHRYVANAIGMYAAVEPTELNSITAELTRRENELETREAAVREREIAVGLSGGEESNDTSIYLLSAILFILLLLILINYVLDYVRAHPVTHAKAS